MCDGVPIQLCTRLKWWQDCEVGDSLSSFSTECILDAVRKIELVGKNDSLRVHATEFDPAEIIVTLLTRARDNPFLIPTPILSNAAIYSMRFRYTSLFRLIAEYSLSRLHAERNAYPMISTDCIALVKRLLTMCAHNYQAHEDLLARLAETIMPQGAEGAHSVLSDLIKDLPLVALLGLIRFMTESPNISRYLSPLDVLTTAVLNNVGGKYESSNKIGAGTWTLYRLVIALVENGHRATALGLFRKLLVFHRFPAAATLQIDEVNTPKLEEIPNAFDAVILMSIARACQLYGWNERNARVLRLLVMRCDASTTRDESDMVSRILHDNITGLITEGTKGTLLNAASLFQQCVENPAVAPPPRHVLESLYTALHRRHMHDTMHSLFSHVQYHAAVRGSTVATPVIDSQLEPAEDEMRYEWPPYRYPCGEACLGLLDYVVTGFKAPKAVRLFATHHANQLHELQDQLPSVPRLIALYAKAGYINEAMRIWSEYRNAETLGGNATAVISLVKSLTFSTAAGIAKKKPAPGRRRQDTTLQTPYEAPPHGVQNAVPANTMECKERCLATARQIAGDFTRLNQPLSTAAHSTLTSIAHVNFLVGDFSKAFAALTAILDRRTVPDEHDIAVAIHGVARSNPVIAASVLDKALERGVSIGKEAWTSVLKEALVMGDYALSEILLQGLNNTGIEIDTNLTDTVIRHGLDFAGASTEDVQDFLERSFTLLNRERQPPPGLVILCTRRALEAGLPSLAFKFWDSLIRAKETDPKQNKNTSIRRAIATSLVQAYARGHENLTMVQCQKMCDRLMAGKTWHRVRCSSM